MKKFDLSLIQIFNRAEYIFTVLACVVFTGAVIPLLIIKGASEGDGIDITAFDYRPQNLLIVLIYLISACLVLLRWKTVLYFASNSPAVILLTLMVPLSLIWSQRPDKTLTGSIGIIGTTLFGLYLGSRFTLKEQLKLLAWACGIVSVLSILFIVFLPKYGIMGGVHAGIPRGAFTHKNGMGKFMVFSTCVFLLMVKDFEGKKFLCWFGLVLSMGLVILSQSTSSLLNTSMLAIFIISTQIFRWKPATLVPAFILVVATSMVFQDLAETILGYFGKDLTLTGRTEIWPLVIEKIQERPILGYGFRGFWSGIDGDSAYVIRALRWGVPDSHNGFLDLTLSLGLMGLSIFLIIYWTTLLKSISVIVKSYDKGELWPMIFMAYLVIVNSSESGLLSEGSFVWILLVSTSISISMEFKRLFSN